MHGGWIEPRMLADGVSTTSVEWKQTDEMRMAGRFLALDHLAHSALGSLRLLWDQGRTKLRGAGSIGGRSMIARQPVLEFETGEN